MSFVCTKSEKKKLNLKIKPCQCIIFRPQILTLFAKDIYFQKYWNELLKIHAFFTMFLIPSTIKKKTNRKYTQE